MGQGSRDVISPKATAIIVDWMRRGNYLETAAGRAGVTGRTVRNWLRRGADEERRQENGEPPTKREIPYLEFAQAVDAAHSEAETTLIDRISVASADDWKAAAWLAERRWRKRWGLNINVHVEAEFTKALARLEKVLPPELYEKALEAITAADEEESDRVA